MKKLSKISLKNATVLDDKQMKQVYGGSGTDMPYGYGELVICSAKCHGNKSVYVLTNYSCIAEDYKGAWGHNRMGNTLLPISSYCSHIIEV